MRKDMPQQLAGSLAAPSHPGRPSAGPSLRRSSVAFKGRALEKRLFAHAFSETEAIRSTGHHEPCFGSVRQVGPGRSRMGSAPPQNRLSHGWPTLKRPAGQPKFPVSTKARGRATVTRIRDCIADGRGSPGQHVVSGSGSAEFRKPKYVSAVCRTLADIARP